MTTSRVIAGRRARALGDRCEQLALVQLTHEGARMQRIATPCVVVGGRKRYTAKVVGDLVGVWPGGRAVIVECKAHASGRKPRPSDFRPHQREELSAWHAAGALVLVAWLEANSSLSLRPLAEVIPTTTPDTGREGT